MKRKSAVFFVSLCAACCFAITPARGNWFFYQNLLNNPGAEDGLASPDGMTIVFIPGWTATGAATVVAYGTPGDFPAVTDPIPHDAGEQFFAGGPDATVSTIFQAIDVPSELWQFIDSSLGMIYIMNAYLGGFGSDADFVSIALSLKNASGDAVETNAIAPVTVADRDSLTALLPRLVHGFVPKGTRRMEVTVVFTRVDGSYNNAYVDNVEVRFHPLDNAPGCSWGKLKALFKNR